MNHQRHPMIGDLIIKTLHDVKHFGIIKDIKLDRWGHQRNVMIAWADEVPFDYQEKHGYAGVNIHNLRHEYEIIRDGVIIK